MPKIEKENKEDYAEIFKEETPKTEKKKLRKVKVLIITSKNVIVDFNGNGESIPFDPTKHATLKLGDSIEIP